MSGLWRAPSLPTHAAWEYADARFALGFWPWSLLAQAEPLPERILKTAADTIVDQALGNWRSPSTMFSAEVRTAYVEALGLLSQTIYNPTKRDGAKSPARVW
ncbi:MAG: hypothetical protein ACRD7E_01495, partial [Bryobacteraceae bacterium]